jgi:hypothetical protein
MPKRRPVQNPEKLAALNALRARRAEEGAVAMAEYKKTQLAARDQLLRLRAARLAREQIKEA